MKEDKRKYNMTISFKLFEGKNLKKVPQKNGIVNKFKHFCVTKVASRQLL